MGADEKVFKLGELFCGPGGLALGAKLARARGWRIEHAWALDSHSDACLTYRRNIGTDAVFCADVRSFDLDSLPEFDALAFGFPCNDFSIVGEQKGLGGDFGPLYRYGAYLLGTQKPKWFLAENVGGIRSADEGSALQKIVREFEDCGYDVVPHLYRLEEYGVPQARHRVILVGIKTELRLGYRVPRPSGVLKSSRRAIEEPPIPPGAPNHELTQQSAQVIERLRHIRPGRNAFNAALPEHLRLNVRGATISQIYRRLDPDKPSYTVTGSGGGGTHVYHWSEDRALTNRERARLQTFPDDFVFCGSKESVRRQIGMAVPPLGAKIIFEAILKTFAGEDYPSIEPNLRSTLAPPVPA